MSRPDDIPQRIWDLAYEASFTGKLPVVANVARAILAAEQREREAIAEMVVSTTKAPAQRNAKDQWVEHIGQSIAAAIRNRGEHHD